MEIAGLIVLAVLGLGIGFIIYVVRADRKKRYRTRDINGRQVAIETDDDMMADAIAATLRTGRGHLANRDDSGHVTVTPIDHSYSHHHHDHGSWSHDSSCHDSGGDFGGDGGGDCGGGD